MSHEWARPQEWRRELHARPAPARRTQDAPDDVTFALVLGGLPQAFDLFVCAILAVAVFPKVFFPGLAPPAAIAAGAGAWALAWPAALLSRRMFAPALEKHGAGVRLAVARLLFAAAGLGLAFLPTANEAAWAPLTLILLRSCQGLGMGGLGHHAKAADRDARFRARALTGAIGLLVAAGLMSGLAVSLSGPDFLAWGWRYPFVAALALNMTALVADLRVGTGRAARPAQARPHLRLATLAGEAVPISRQPR